MSKNIEEKFRALDDRTHILSRPGMYIGSVAQETILKYVLNEKSKFEKRSISWNPGFNKLFDEIISNSVDESKRPDTKLDTIKVEIDTKSGEISVWDNGGIPVEMHSGEKMYVPEMVFSKLRAGSNFNDDETRTGVGTNGVGSSCVNIFSNKFVVETADGKNKFKQKFENNMSKRSTPKVEPTDKHFTKITYLTDFDRFKMSGIDDDNFKCLESRVYEIAGANPSLKIYFQGKQIKIKSFEDYCKMFTDDPIIFESNGEWEVGIAPSKDSYQQVSFANGVNTWVGGTHLDYVLFQITQPLRERLKKKYKQDILPGQLRNHMFLFLNSTVKNPAFSSQTKERLISQSTDFINPIKLSEKFINKILKSEIVNLVADWLDQKKQADERAAEREANRAIAKVKVEKLVDCSFAGGVHKNGTSLSITEGDSAVAGFRKFRDPKTQAFLPIRGKLLNVRGEKKEKIFANTEIKAIMVAMGLQFGKSPFEYDKTGKLIKDNLRIHEIRIYSDADVDGHHIASLILNFVACFWPELIKEHRVARVDTPVLIASKGKDKHKFYYDSEFKEWCKKNDVSKYDVEYYKGLGALDDDNYKEIVTTPNIYYYDLDDSALNELEIWMGSDSSKRKEKLLK